MSVFRDLSAVALAPEMLMGTRKGAPRGKFELLPKTFIPPSPYDLLARAFRLGGSAGVVFMLAHYRKTLIRGLPITIPGHDRGAFGISPDAYHRALDKLDADGLIRVVKQPAPKATVITWIADTVDGAAEGRG